MPPYSRTSITPIGCVSVMSTKCRISEGSHFVYQKIDLRQLYSKLVLSSVQMMNCHCAVGPFVECHSSSVALGIQHPEATTDHSLVIRQQLPNSSGVKYSFCEDHQKHSLTLNAILENLIFHFILALSSLHVHCAEYTHTHVCRSTSTTCLNIVVFK